MVKKKGQYQDGIVDGKVTSKGERECSSRYDYIRKVLDKFDRPFSFFDLGANNGYFGFRVAWDYPESVVIMADGSDIYSPGCLELCARQSRKNIIMLQRNMSPEDLQGMRSCEHIDVSICLGVLHHYDNWIDYVSSIWFLADDTILETPPENDYKSAKIGERLKAIDNHLSRLPHEVIGEGERPRNVKTKLRHYRTVRQNIQFRYLSKVGEKQSRINRKFFWINSDNQSKNLYKVTADGNLTNSTFIPGINLVTFLKLGGVWPDRSTIKKQAFTLIKNEYGKHSDPGIRNMIVTNGGLKLIDYEDSPAKRPLEEYLRQAKRSFE